MRTKNINSVLIVWFLSLIALTSSHAQSKSFSMDFHSGLMQLSTADATLGVLGLTLNKVDSISYFQLCSSYASESLTFTNASATIATNSYYRIDWGDGSPVFSSNNWTSQTHLYKAGHWIIHYEVTDIFGNTSSQLYHIYIVSNPAVSLGSPGNTDNCIDVPLTFPITGTENNPPGTTYTITFNDGTSPQVFSTNLPGEITHTFKKSSCGVTSYNGTVPYPNSFSASIVASNSCGVSAVNVVPIYISTSPDVDFDVPNPIVPINKKTTITNKTTGYVNLGANCSVVPKLVWKITPSTGFTLSSGTLGNDYNSDNSNLWVTGSDIIAPVFTTPGIYTIKLRVDTKRCGTDSLVKTICVESPLSPQFSLDNNNDCSPLRVVAANNTILSSSCSAKATWSVTYTANFGGKAPATWSFTDSTSASSLDTAIFRFVTPGNYSIKLTMTNTAGVYSLTKGVVVRGKPIISLKKSGSYCGTASYEPVATIISGTPAAGTLSYLWEFPGGNPAKSTKASPGIINYSSPGIYPVTLTVSNECTTSVATDTVVVYSLPLLTNVAGQLKNNGDMSDAIVWGDTTQTRFIWQNSNSSIGLVAKGTGNIPSFRLINNSDSVVHALITVTPVSIQTGCSGQPFTLPVTVNPDAAFVQPTDVLVSNGDSVHAVIFKSHVRGGTMSYRWENSQPEIGLDASGTANIGAFVAHNITNKPIRAILTVYGTFTSSNVTTDEKVTQFLITVLPTADVAVVENKEYCNGIQTTPIVFSTANEGGLTTYEWTNDTPGIGLPSSGKGTIASFMTTNNTDSKTVATIRVTPVYSVDSVSNRGLSRTFTITVNPGATIRKQPNSVSVCKGAAIDSLRVDYENGTDSPVFQWYRSSSTLIGEGTEIPGANTAAYLPSTQIVGETYYYCVLSFASGVCRDVTSLPALVQVSEPAHILAQPVKSQFVCLGGSMADSLKITYAGGAGTMHYQWFMNSTATYEGAQAITGATEPFYVPSGYKTSGRYFYYVRLTSEGSGCGTVYSEFSELLVVSDPVIVVQPLSGQAVCQGSVAEALRVQASGGVGPFAYQWYLATVNDNSKGIAISGATESIYIPQTTIHGTYYYYCILSQREGKGCSVSSAIAILDVNPVASLSEQPSSYTVCAGDSLPTLEVKWRNGVGAPHAQWFVSASADTISSVAIPGADTPVYTIQQKIPGTFWYYCVLNFDGGCRPLISHAARIELLPFPVISSVETVLCNHSDYQFNPAVVEGNHVPDGTTYTWDAPVVSPVGAVSGLSAATVPVAELKYNFQNQTDSLATVTYHIRPVSGSCVGKTFDLRFRILPNLKLNAALRHVSCYGLSDGALDVAVKGTFFSFAQGSYTFRWTGPAGFSSNASSINGLVAGNYHLDVSYAANCTAGFDYTITQPDSLVLKVNNQTNVLCAGDKSGKIELVVSGGTLPYKFHWTKDGAYYADTQNLEHLSGGIYELKMMDANACTTVTRQFVVKEPAPLKIESISKTNSQCFGDSTGSATVVVSGGTAPYAYCWTLAGRVVSTVQNPVRLTGGNYMLQVTDSNLCSSTFAVEIVQPQALLVSAQVIPASCYGDDNASVSLAISGGTAPYTVSWSHFAKGAILEHLAPGNYVATVTDAAGCAMTVAVVVPSTQFSINPEIRNVSCHGAADGRIILHLSGGVKPVTLSWQDDPNAGASRYQLAPGFYTVILHDGSGCTISQTYLIAEPPALHVSANLTPSNICGDNSSGKIKLTVDGGVAPYAFKWSNGAESSGIEHLTAGRYYVMVTDSAGCTFTADYEIKPQSALAARLTTKLNFDCERKQFVVSCVAGVTGGSGVYRYAWNGGQLSGQNTAFETYENGLVTLLVYDSTGCSATVTQQVNVPVLGVYVEKTDCNSHMYQFYAVGNRQTVENMQCSWDFGDGEQSALSNPQHLFPSEGVYSVRLTVSLSGCAASRTAQVFVTDKAVLKLDKAPLMCVGDSLLLGVSGGNEYKWSTGATGSKALIRKPGVYSVVSKSTAGCTDTLYFNVSYFNEYHYAIYTDSSQVSESGYPMRFWSDNVPYTEYSWDFGDGHTATGMEVGHSFAESADGYYDVKLRATSPDGCVEESIRRVWSRIPELPNTFSPNGDGINDLFLENWHIKVYSRNGIELYDGNRGWDGKYKGQPVSPGFYYYVLYYPGERGTRTSGGYVRVIR